MTRIDDVVLMHITECFGFAEWVAKQVCQEDFDEDGTFAEMACRKLWRLGIVRMNGDDWEYGEVDDEHIVERL